MSQHGKRTELRIVSTRGLAAGVLAALIPLSAIAASDADPRYAAVNAPGRLNGVALQCKYIDQVRHMKAAVVASAPKERSYGLAFDEATNEAFLAFIQDDAPCPSHAELARRVGHKVDAMNAAFAAP